MQDKSGMVEGKVVVVTGAGGGIDRDIALAMAREWSRMIGSIPAETPEEIAVRNNEIFLISQPRPVRSVHRSEGWTPHSVASHALPALQAMFHPLERSGDVFSWTPI